MKTPRNSQALAHWRRLHHRLTTAFTGVGFMIGMLIGASSGVALPRQPMPPLPEMHLRTWRFDDALRQYPNGQAPALIPEMDLVESWSGYALRREGNSAIPFVIPEVELTNRVNFTCGTGSIRVWFHSTWGSASVHARGPGGYARLVELVGLSGSTSTVWWSLYASPDGNTLHVSGQGPVGPTDFLQAEIQWAADTWHLVTLTYSSASCALFVDGELAGIGDPLPVPQPLTASELALVLGGDAAGSNLAQGQFDEFTTFNRACDPLEVAWYYSRTAGRVALGALSDAEIAQQTRSLNLKVGRSSARSAVFSESSPQMLLLSGSTSLCITNPNVWIANMSSSNIAGQGWTVAFDIQGGTNSNNLLYDIFTSTNIAGTNVANAQWTWLERGPTCSTYEYTNQPQSGAFFVLGMPLDSDGDGLTDAFEYLVSKTRVNGADTDNDMLTDADEVALGLDPLVDQSAQTGARHNYTYDLLNKIRIVTGVVNMTFTLDKEGNITNVAP